MKISSKNIGTIGYVEEKLYIVMPDGLEPLTDSQAETLLDINNIPVRLAKYASRKKSSRKGE